MPNFILKETVDENVLPNTPFTQAPFYGLWQKNLYRLVKNFAIYDTDRIVASYQVICYPLGLGWNYFYIPYGPIILNESEDLFIFIKKHLLSLARENKAVFVRLDFTPAIKNEVLINHFRLAPKYTYHSAYFQPRHEWILDLTPSEDQLLQNMDKDTRYSIRLAQRKDITTEIVESNFEQYFERFYELMSETATRNNFSLHLKKYYEGVFSTLNQVKDSYLSIARFENKILAINVILVFKGMANYVYAASSSEERNRAPAYLAQWVGILHAKKINCLWYNFGGITDPKLENKSWAGLTFFKKNFGGEILTHSDFYDLVVNKPVYNLYCLRKLFQKIKKGV